MAKRKPAKKDGPKKPSDFSHLKWPAIIMAILFVVLVIALDYCSREGNL